MDHIESKEVVLNVKVKNLDSHIEKAKKYVELLKEAKTLEEELASIDFEIKII